MPLETRSPFGEIRHWLIFLALSLGLAGWFYYDGAIGYHAQNVKEAKKNALLAARSADAEVWLQRDTPTDIQGEALVKQAPTLASAVQKELGPPVISEPEGGETFERYVSRYGMLTVRSRSDRILTDGGLTWVTWKHGAEKVRAQFWWMSLPLLFGVWPLVRLAQALLLRVRLDEQGLRYGGLQISWDQMVALRDYNPKGWVDLYYRLTPDSDERRLRLDKLKIQRFRELVDEIWRHKGFANPWEAEAAPAQPQTPPAAER